MPSFTLSVWCILHNENCYCVTWTPVLHFMYERHVQSNNSCTIKCVTHSCRETAQNCHTAKESWLSKTGCPKTDQQAHKLLALCRNTVAKHNKSSSSSLSLFSTLFFSSSSATSSTFTLSYSFSTSFFFLFFAITMCSRWKKKCNSVVSIDKKVWSSYWRIQCPIFVFIIPVAYLHTFVYFVHTCIDIIDSGTQAYSGILNH